MKRFYTLILLIATPFIGFSQSIISNVVPNFGDQFVYNQQDEAPSPGSAGADITWDFSNETITEYSSNYSVKTPEEVDGSDDYPGATMVWIVNLEDIVLASFMSFENNTFSTYGTKSDFSGMSAGVNYSDPIDQFTYPMSYQDTGTDNYSGNVFGFTGDNDIEGTQSYIVDGYGTVITPFGTYDNVLRITMTATETITSFGVETVTNRLETFWYTPNYPVPVMIISSTDGGGSEPSSAMTALLSYTSVSTSLANRSSQNAFDVYPNPASDHITVKADGLNANSTLKIYSANGKLTKEVSINGNGNVDVSELSSGLYIAVILVDGKQYAQKLFSVVR